MIDIGALPEPAQPPAKTVKSKPKKQAQRDAAAVIDADFDDLSAGPDNFIIADLRSALWFPSMLQKHGTMGRGLNRDTALHLSKVPILRTTRGSCGWSGH